MRTSPTLDRLIDPLSRCLTDESAQRVLRLRADRKLQARIDELADKNTEGLLTEEERLEYRDYVTFSTFISLLKSKARQRLSRSTGD